MHFTDIDMNTWCYCSNCYRSLPEEKQVNTWDVEGSKYCISVSNVYCPVTIYSQVDRCCSLTKKYCLCYFFIFKQLNLLKTGWLNIKSDIKPMLLPDCFPNKAIEFTLAARITGSLGDNGQRGSTQVTRHLYPHTDERGVETWDG